MKKIIVPSVLFVVATLFFLPFILTGTVPYVGDYSGSDLYELNLPFRMASAEMWRHGEVPLWSPLLAHGFPLLAEGQAGVFYPLNIFFVFLPWPAALAAVLILSFYLSSIFTYLLARRYGISRGGACIAALAFSFSSFFIFRLKHLNLINAATWLPLIFYIIERYHSRGRTLVFSLAMGVVLAIQLFAGHPQITYLTVIAAGVYTLIRWLWIRPQSAGNIPAWKIVIFWFIAGAFALGLSAVQLLPTLELAQHSGRGKWASYSESVKLSLAPVELLTLINPYIFGNPATDTYRGSDLQFKGGFWEDTLYVGVIPFLLAVLAVSYRRSSITAVMAALIALSFFFMFVQYNLLFPFVWALVPGMKIFRFFQRFSFVFVLALAILSGIGFDILASKLKTLPEKLRTPFVRRGAVIVLVLAVIIDLFWVGWQYFGAVPVTYFNEPSSVVWLRKNGGQFRIASMLYQLSWSKAYSINNGWATAPDVFLDQRSVVQPNLNLVWGVESINDRGWDEGGQLDARLSKILQSHIRHWSFDGKALTLSTSSVSVLGMQNAEYLISFYDLNGPGLTLERRIPQTLLPAIKIYRNNFSLPRAFMVGTSTIVANDDDAVAMMFDPAFNPRQNVIIDHLPTGWTGSGALAATTTVEVTAPRAVTVATDASGSGILFVSNLYYPGWNATIDGKPAEVVRANVSFMAVVVPAGAHRVTFSYHPKSFLVGVVVSGITFGLLILSVAWWFIHRRAQL